MKALIKKQTGIIQVPENFATLETVVNNRFRYKVRYLADPALAVQNQSLIVQIHVSQNAFIKKLQPVFNVANPAIIIQNVLRKVSLQKDILRTSRSDYILTLRSDISSRIPNNTTQRLTLSRFGQNLPIRLHRLLTTKPVSELNDLNLNLPVFDLNVNRTNVENNNQSGNQELKKQANSLLFVDGKDPASFTIEKSNTFVSAQKALAGTKPAKNYTEKASIRNSTMGRNLVSSLLTKNSATSQIELGQNEFMNVSEQREQNLIEIEEIIDIPMAALNDSEFYLIFQVTNNKNFELQTISGLVKHARNLQLLVMPTKPPQVKTFPISRPGKAVFEVTQQDANAKGILIYRREIKPNLPVIDASYTFVGKIEISRGQPSQKVEDLVATINPIIYRFIPYTDESTPSTIFSTVVAQFQRKIAAKRSNYKPRQSFCSMDYTIKESALSVDIKDYPSTAVAMKLFRRDLSIKQKAFDIVGNDVTLLDSNSNAPIFIDDTAVKTNRIYEYQVAFLYRDGTETRASNNLIVNYTPVVNNVATTTISDPQIIQNDDALDVTFAVTFNILNQNADLVKKFLSDQGFLAEFQDQITASRDQLTRLFAYGVSRTNLTTGEIENFGIVDSNDFSDRKFGLSKNVKPLDAGSEYKYTITTYFRNPETLFSTLTRSAVSSTGVAYSFKPFKWLQPITLQTGNLVTARTIQKNHAKGTFEQGQIADVQTVNISLANLLPSLSNGRLIQVRDNANLIQWKVDGSIAKIDHFIVMLESLGIRSVAGTTHNISNSNYFEFLDVLTNGERGGLTYFIVPVFYDYSRGTELKTNTIVI